MLRFKLLFLLPLVACVAGQNNGIGYYGSSNVRDQRRYAPQGYRPRPPPLSHRPLANPLQPTPMPSYVPPASTPAYVPLTYPPGPRPYVPPRPMRQPPPEGPRLTPPVEATQPPAAATTPPPVTLAEPAPPVAAAPQPPAVPMPVPASPEPPKVEDVKPEKEPREEETSPLIPLEPEPKPEPAPISPPESDAESEPLPVPQPEPAPKPEPVSQPKPAPQPEPKPQPEYVPEVDREPQPEPTIQPQPAPKPQPIPDAPHFNPDALPPYIPEPPEPSLPEVRPVPQPTPKPVTPPQPELSSGALLPLLPKPKPIREPVFGRPTQPPFNSDNTYTTEPIYETSSSPPPVSESTRAPPAISSSQAPDLPGGSYVEDFFCKKPYGYYAVEKECDAYIQCQESIAMKYYCPDGLHFKPSANRFEYPCAYPSEVKCQPGSEIQKPKPTDQCPRQYGFFPMNDGDCSKYIMCQEGAATIMNCPAGLVFNPEYSSCDWVVNVPQCNPHVFKDYTCPDPPVLADGSISDIIYKYKYGQQCREYIACQRGHPRLLSCDHGLAFDEVSQSCINDDYVHGCSTTVVY